MIEAPLDSNPAAGLTAAEAAARAAAGRSNRPPKEGLRPYLDIVRRNTLTLFNALVAPAAVALFLLADYRGAWAVSAMAVANAVLGLAHELRAKRHLDRLSILAEARVRVRRDGEEVAIPSSELVEGDCVLLSPGDAVAADGTVVEAEFLELDESLLTGESDPAPRAVGEAVRSGSVCVAGAGAYVAEQVGAAAYALRTAAAAREYRHAPGPTQRTLDRLVQALTALAVLLCAGYVALFYLRGFPVAELVRMIAATITSMVPQGLALLATLTFVLAATRLGRRGAVIRRLAAVEGLAAIDVLCSDKTGTLTTGRQTLERLVPFSVDEAEARRWLAAYAAVSVDRRNASIAALRAALESEAPSAAAGAQRPFQSRHRFSAAAVTIESETRLLLLGGFEKLRDRFPDSDRAAMDAAFAELLPQGVRLLAFAAAEDSAAPIDRLPDVPLRPLAFVVLRDELRPAVADVLAELARQEIALKIVSGDAPETVHATVRSLGGAIGEEKPVTGDEWAAAPDRADFAARHQVFGRVAPEQKLDLIQTMQAAGRNVGMIGDGVNDLLPIKKADFGVAMGAASPATKAVAGVVLENDDFASLPAVLAEGRLVVANVRCAAKLFLLKNAYTVAFILVAVGVCGLPFPYLPQQVTLLNALSIGGPAVLILAGRKPAGPVAANFFADVGRFVLVAGGATALAGLALYLSAMRLSDGDPALPRTLLVSMLILAGVGNAVLAARGDRRLVAWAGFAVVALAIVFAVPPFAYFFAFAAPTASQWAIVVGLAAAIVAAVAFLTPAESRAGENRPPAAGDPTPAARAASAPPRPPE